MSVHELDTFLKSWACNLLCILGGASLIAGWWGMAGYLYSVGAFYFWQYRQELKSQIATLDKKIEGCEVELLNELSKLGIKPKNVRPLNS